MPISHVIGFDDFPFEREHRGDVGVVGVVFAGSRLDGVVSGRVRRDGANGARVLAALIAGSKFEHLQLVMLQGIALAGFNVVDVFDLHARAGLPVLVVARRAPDFDAVRNALSTRVKGGGRKWSIIERLGPMEPVAGVYIQRIGIDPETAAAAVRRFQLNGKIPEPLRVAHLIAGGIARGESRGRT